MGYTYKIIKGLSWMGGLRAGIRVITILRISLLARLLSPAQFGIFGIATLVLSFTETFTETGINIFLINAKKNIADYVSSAWIISICRGIIISSIIYFLAPFIAGFFNSLDATYIIRLIAIVPFIRGFINPAVIIYQKELQFSKEFIFRIILYFIEASIAITLAYITRSVTSLVWAMIISAITEVLLSFIVIKIKPTLNIDTKKIVEIVNHGKWVTLTGIFNYLFHNGDNIVVGKLLGVSALGYYDTAYRISMLPITEVGNVIQQVTLPIYSRLHTERTRLLQALFKTFIGVSCLTIPMGILFFYFPHKIILILLGPNWEPAIPILQVLAIFGVARAISSIPVSLFYAIGKESYVTVITLVSFLVLAITIVPFINNYGIIGAGFSSIAATFITIPVILYYLFKVFRRKV